jgi:hypothetical protein
MGSAQSDIPGLEYWGRSYAGGFTLPFGYVDASGTVHRDLFLRELTGKEEELMDCDDLNIAERTSRILTACIEKIGTITDKDIISRAVTDNLETGLPLTYQDRIAALLYLRRVTLGDILKFERKCPACGFLNKNKQLDLRDQAIKFSKDPKKRKAGIKLPKSGKVVTLKVLTAKGEEEISLLDSKKEASNYAILARIDEIDGRKISISKECLEEIRLLSKVDRLYIIEAYSLMEGTVDTDVQVICKKAECGVEFTFFLDIGQSFFLQPGKEPYYGPGFYGSRYHTFLPVGSRTRLESDIICLFEAYNQPYDDIMNMPSSRRHRLIKIREMIVDQQKSGSSDPSAKALTFKTGNSPRASKQMGPQA